MVLTSEYLGRGTSCREEFTERQWYFTDLGLSRRRGCLVTRGEVGVVRQKVRKKREIKGHRSANSVLWKYATNVNSSTERRVLV